jgi:general secretion pathway protein A
VYTKFFGLNEKPFSITPDPRYLYLSERYADALAHLIYGVSESGGFIQLTGEVGTGKTTLVRSLLERLPEQADVALVLNPQLSTLEFLQAICEEVGATLPSDRTSTKALVDALNRHLLKAHARGRRTVLIVDEAQNLSTEVLEQVRLLTNLETAKQKLLQIILIGQPELRDVLDRSDMRQLAQRITGRYHLQPLTRADADEYLRHRLKVAGAVTEIFTPGAIRELHRCSQGIPRIVNVISDRALLAAYSRETHKVDARLVRYAAREVYGRKFVPPWQSYLVGAAGMAGLALVAMGAWRMLADPGAADPTQTIAMGSVPEQRSSSAASQAVEPQPVVTATPAQDSEPLANLGPYLVNPRYPTDTESAFRTLFAMWGAQFRSGAGTACEQASAQGLSCLFQRGAWSNLQRLNRPAILELIDEAGNEHQVVLKYLARDWGELSFGADSVRVSLVELSKFWFGDHLLLWKPALSQVQQLSPGMRDEGVRWLRDSLTQISGQSATPSDPLLYDPALEARVREYQRERRLNVDGLVGVQTQIIINTDLASANTPLLVRAH